MLCVRVRQSALSLCKAGYTTTKELGAGNQAGSQPKRHSMQRREGSTDESMLTTRITMYGNDA